MLEYGLNRNIANKKQRNKGLLLKLKHRIEKWIKQKTLLGNHGSENCIPNFLKINETFQRFQALNILQKIDNKMLLKLRLRNKNVSLSVKDNV